MTAGQLRRNARNVTIACARRGGLPYAVLAEAWGLTDRRVKAIAEDLVGPEAHPEALKDSLVGLIKALEERREASRRPSKKFTRRAATL